MMLGLNGRPSEVPTFTYQLAHELHKTVEEIENMPRSEYENWAAYFTARHALENLRPVGKGFGA